jgi:hypothetical protein
MKNWNEPETIEEIRNYVENAIKRIKNFHEFEIDHSLKSKNSPFGEAHYLNAEIERLINEGIDKSKYSSGCLVGDWINQKRIKLTNIAKEVSDYMFEWLKVNNDYSGFRGNIDNFLLIYLQWVNINKLLKNCKDTQDKPTTYEPLMEVVRDDLKKEFTSYLRNLEPDFEIRTCSKTAFSAICYRIYISQCSTRKGISYIRNGMRECSFEEFKRIMAECFRVKEPKATKNKAQMYYEQLPIGIKARLDKLFT